MPHRFAYAHAVSFAEILEEIPNLSFTQRQELVRRAIALDEDDLTPEENALLDARMEDFRRDPGEGIPLEQLRDQIAGRRSRE
jgi:putative addiction module component (TIGR02574 family)